MKILIVGNRFPNPNQVFVHNKIIGIAQTKVGVVNLSGDPVSRRELAAVNRESGTQIRAYNYASNTFFIRNLVYLSFLNPVLLGRLIAKCYNGVPFKLFLSTLRTNLSLLSLSLRVDVIHFEWNNHATAFVASLDSLRKPYVVSIRGRGITSQPEADPQLKSKLFYVFAKATFIHSISNDLLKYLERYPHSSDCVRVINPAVNLKTIRNKKQRVWNETRIITVAHYRWKKNLPAAIKVIAKLVNTGVSIRYELVGEGPDREHLHFLIDELKMRDHVILVGRRSHDWVLDRLSESDIFLMPSIQEGFCNSVIEAQATGIPCVVTDAEGLSENVEHGKTALVVSRFDSDEMEKALLHLIENPKIQAEFGENGKARALSKFDSHQQIDQFIKLYQEAKECYGSPAE